jgi:hypothetical protein
MQGRGLRGPVARGGAARRRLKVAAVALVSLVLWSQVLPALDE